MTLLRDHILEPPNGSDCSFRCTECGQEWPMVEGMLEKIKEDLCIPERIVSSEMHSVKTLLGIIKIRG